MPHRILVIDDAPDLALVMRMLLERAGHEVISAENGRRGLRLFFEDRPDLVVLRAELVVVVSGRRTRTCVSIHERAAVVGG